MLHMQRIAQSIPSKIEYTILIKCTCYIHLCKTDPEPIDFFSKALFHGTLNPESREVRERYYFFSAIKGEVLY